MSSASPLRTFLNRQFSSQGIISPFTIAPDLQCNLIDSSQGLIEVLALKQEEDIVFSRENVHALGAMMALTFWFGLGDLHRENLSIGYLDRKFICFPIDIECIFDHLSHIKQTLLVPSDRIPRENCGLADIWPKLVSLTSSEKADLISTFSKTINLLNENLQKIHSLLEDPSIGQFCYQPVRIIVRDTIFYKKRLEDLNFKNLYTSEVEQLKRGDIPYFFRFPGEKTIQYLTGPSKSEPVDFDISDFDVPAPIPFSSRSFCDLKKLKSALLSINHIATSLGLDAEMEHLSQVQVSYESFKLSYEEIDSKICINFDHL